MDIVKGKTTGIVSINGLFEKIADLELTKQDLLVNQVNIKSVNGKSLIANVGDQPNIEVGLLASLTAGQKVGGVEAGETFAKDDSLEKILRKILAAQDSLDSISIKTKPTKMEYEQGQQFNPAGMIVTCHYASGNTIDITSGFTCSPMTLTQAGEKIIITVSYGNCNTTLTVKVTPQTRTLTGIEITSIRQNFVAGDVIKKSDMVVKAIYSTTQGEVKEEISDYTYTPTGQLSAGPVTVTVTYQGHNNSTTIQVEEPAPIETVKIYRGCFITDDEHRPSTDSDVLLLEKDDSNTKDYLKANGYTYNNINTQGLYKWVTFAIPKSAGLTLNGTTITRIVGEATQAIEATISGSDSYYIITGIQPSKESNVTYKYTLKEV